MVKAIFDDMRNNGFLNHMCTLSKLQWKRVQQYQKINTLGAFGKVFCLVLLWVRCSCLCIHKHCCTKRSKTAYFMGYYILCTIYYALCAISCRWCLCYILYTNTKSTARAGEGGRVSGIYCPATCFRTIDPNYSFCSAS